MIPSAVAHSVRNDGANDAEARSDDSANEFTCSAAGKYQRKGCSNHRQRRALCGQQERQQNEKAHSRCAVDDPDGGERQETATSDVLRQPIPGMAVRAARPNTIAVRNTSRQQ